MRNAFTEIITVKLQMSAIGEWYNPLKMCPSLLRMYIILNLCSGTVIMLHVSNPLFFRAWRIFMRRLISGISKLTYPTSIRSLLSCMQGTDTDTSSERVS